MELVEIDDATAAAVNARVQRLGNAGFPLVTSDLSSDEDALTRGADR